MLTEQGMISSKQLSLIMLSLIEASTFTAVFVSQYTKQDTWVVLISGFIIVLFLLFMYVSLCSKFPGKTIIEIHAKIYGNLLVNLISLLYIFYFWFIIPANFRFLADFFSTYLSQNSDIIPFIIPAAILCIYAVRKGAEVISRVSSILSILTVMLSIIITALIAKDIHISNLLPPLQLNLGQFVQGTNIMVAIPLGEIIVFMIFFPHLNDQTKLRKSAFTGLILSFIFFLFVLVRNTLVLGNVSSLQVQPAYQVSSLINVGEVITRVEVTTAVFLLFNLLMKICFFLYATVISIAQCFKLRSYKPLVFPVTAISAVLSITMFKSPLDQLYIASDIYPIYALLFIVILPITSFILASIKKSSKTAS
ncbi:MULTISPECIES: endospore germination permease [Clostridium]|uniref:endospore germination permease n=1 Tax=Clostridium TaxID=1485 RepID=UPI000CF3EE05|nr:MULTISPECIES: endospore germination permease [Clostridium]AWV82308.1 spore gernimation protein [Clostridium acetobutylicum]PSM04345.1 spore gernimation protein [Clostridium sp. NJ4]TQD46498.1 GerAB/ArcD/ProY family transporter [Clostridium acetobutylicum]